MKKLPEEKMEVYSLAKQDFYREIMPQTRKAIRAMIEDENQDFQRDCRIRYLKGKMTGLICEAWNKMGMYQEYSRQDKTIERLLIGEKIQAIVTEIWKIQGELISLKKPEKNNGRITDEMIARAKAYPMNQLVEIGRYNTLVCPFHGDTKASMKYYPNDNSVYCFSCKKTWDVIGFIQERDKLSFPEAVKKLQ